MDLESLKREIEYEIQRLDQRRAILLDQMAHLRALELADRRQQEESVLEEAAVAKGSTGSAEEHLGPEPEKMSWEEMLAAVRCLRCGASLRGLIPTNSKGEPSLSSPRLGKAEGSNRYLECPQCQARNVFVRTTGPRGWRLLVTQLKQ